MFIVARDKLISSQRQNCFPSNIPERIVAIDDNLDKTRHGASRYGARAVSNGERVARSARHGTNVRGRAANCFQYSSHDRRESLTGAHALGGRTGNPLQLCSQFLSTFTIMLLKNLNLKTNFISLE